MQACVLSVCLCSYTALSTCMHVLQLPCTVFFQGTSVQDSSQVRGKVLHVDQIWLRTRVFVAMRLVSLSLKAIAVMIMHGRSRAPACDRSLPVRSVVGRFLPTGLSRASAIDFSQVPSPLPALLVAACGPELLARAGCF